MSNKYYTPTIEEFRVGFEYYRQEDIITGPFEVTYVGQLITLDEYIDELRIKYLDKQDIESLGFNEITEDTFEKKKTGDPLVTYYIDYFQIENSDNIFLKIGQDVLSYEDILFQGYCKNKSELITLLRQLNIS